MVEATARRRLAARLGIETSFADLWGAERGVSSRTLRRVFAAFGFTVDSEAAAAAALQTLDSRAAAEILPPVHIVRADAPLRLPLNLPGDQAAALHWQLRLEDGSELTDEIDPAALMLPGGNAMPGRRLLSLPGSLPLGYHHLRLFRAGVSAPLGECRLIVVPSRCFQPDSLTHGDRLWGIAVQLYALRSPRNWGIGDFSDLAEVVAKAAGAGAAAVGVNPLHALFLDDPGQISPYAPSSRMFLNPLYLDVPAIAEFTDCAAARALVAEPAFQTRLVALRDAALVDYPGVAACKLPVLELLYRQFRRDHLRDPPAASERARAFRAFQSERGQALRHFAVFQVLREVLGRDDPGLRYWRRWPRRYRQPESAATLAFAVDHGERVEYFEYLQWQAAEQLADCLRAARQGGMAIGLYNDLAVGVEGGGAEAWALQATLAPQMVVGAPPDEWNRKGQKWGFPPFNPARLRELAYAPFIAHLRANMRHGGALRIDHVAGLMRLFWIPEKLGADEGAYVAGQFEDQLGLLALESQRNRCLIIGEDLGTVPDGLRPALARAGVLSNRLLYFERDLSGDFQAPQDYPAQALVAIGTHDLPPLAGYWSGHDIDIKFALGFFADGDEHDEMLRQREAERLLLAAALRNAGLLAPGPTPEGAPVLAAYRYLAATPSSLLMVQLEDLLGLTEQVNVPATRDEHPNWRRKLPLEIDALFEVEAVRSALPAIALARRLPPPGGEPLPPDLQTHAPPPPPTATYRLQFTPDFGFRDATRLLPYLQALGVSHIYASPVFKARPGSTHGYDIIDHNALNPELGTAQDFEHFCRALRAQGFGLILDFVPNHMGIGYGNPWWLDVLEWGQASPYADYFDIDWHSANGVLAGKVLLPVLGDHYGVVLEAGGLVLRFDAGAGSFYLTYGDHRFPIRPRDYAPLVRRYLRTAGDAAAVLPAPIRADLERLLDAFAGLRIQGLSPRRQAEVHLRGQALKAELAAQVAGNALLAEVLTAAAAAANGRPGVAPSYRPLHRLLERQAYRLAFWRAAGDEINYRRFFDINELAGLRIEEPALFDACHHLVGQWLAEGKVQGLRIDHIDGLFDPAGYCHRLRAFCDVQVKSWAAVDAVGEAAAKAVSPEAPAPPFYLVVEKILAAHESLRVDWPVDGTTGYDFGALLNRLFVDGAARTALDRAYRRFTGEARVFDHLLAECKRLVMDSYLASELNVLAGTLDRLSEHDWNSRDFTRQGLRRALRAVLARFPVYRTYIGAGAVAAADRAEIDRAVALARQDWREPGPDILDFIGAVLRGDWPPATGDAAPRRRARQLLMKFQQYSSPVMAKAMEDTAFYRFSRLLSLNEVGGDPREFAVDPAEFHRRMAERAVNWPRAMLATATHDSKRGEDVRARLNVLSECAGEWERAVRHWSRLNQPQLRRLDDSKGARAPSREDEYFIYQVLLGTWPLSRASASRARFLGRLQHYLVKALREAKQHTSWTEPDADYEDGCRDFVDRILDERSGQAFLAAFSPFQRKIAWFGMLNGLAQTVVKLTAPGVPDIYRGTELWDLTMVDPDNRRPVDFAYRRERLRLLEAAEDQARPGGAAALLGDWHDGTIKLDIIRRLLICRRANPALFVGGGYLPLAVSGANADHVLAFARRAGDACALSISGRLFVGLSDGDGSIGRYALDWGDGRVELFAGAPERWRDLLTGETPRAEGPPDRRYLPLAAVLRLLPVAVLVPA